MTEHFLYLNGDPVALDGVTAFVDNHNLSHIDIQLQSAPVSEVGVDGLQIDDVIMVMHDIIQSFQNRFPCLENEIVLASLLNAKKACDLRTQNRQKRNVEGKSEA